MYVPRGGPRARPDDAPAAPPAAARRDHARRGLSKLEQVQQSHT